MPVFITSGVFRSTMPLTPNSVLRWPFAALMEYILPRRVPKMIAAGLERITRPVGSAAQRGVIAIRDLEDPLLLAGG